MSRSKSLNLCSLRCGYYPWTSTLDQGARFLTGYLLNSQALGTWYRAINDANLPAGMIFHPTIITFDGQFFSRFMAGGCKTMGIAGCHVISEGCQLKQEHAKIWQRLVDCEGLCYVLEQTQMQKMGQFHWFSMDIMRLTTSTLGALRADAWSFDY